MKESNVIDFIDYQEHLPENRESLKNVPEDLISAIQVLINRLREDDPIPQVTTG